MEKKDRKEEINRREFLKRLGVGAAASTIGLAGCNSRNNIVSGNRSALGEIPTDQMTYRTHPRTGDKVSLLGYGCMRFTKNGNSIDLDKAERELMLAIKSGVNYLDTAYIYPGSEVAVGEILHRNHCREEIRLATKLPQYYIKSGAAIEKYFNEQLTRLQTDYIDYYLMHMLTDIPTWEKLKKIGMQDWIEEKLASGQIRNIGFSYHGNTEMFKQLVDAYDWDFCQIQYNYMDTEEQAGDKGYALAEELGIPLVIMEPVKGGSLANFSDDINAKFKAMDKDASIASWAFRWVGSHSNAKVILSGMSNEEQVEDNLKTFSNFKPLNEAEEKMISEIVSDLQGRVQNGCTGCRYCMPCPAGVNIPQNFALWNKYHIYGTYDHVKNAWEKDLKDEEKAKCCVKCGKCEKVCPQHLSIRRDLELAQKDLDSAAAAQE